MKKSLLLLPAIGFFSFTLFTNGVVVEDVAAFSTGAPAAKTGAPGEGNCTDCHNGNTMSGAGVNTITFSGSNFTYDPNTTYQITVDVANSTKTGFQMTALDGTNAMAGTFTGGTNSTTQNSGGKNYINHNASVGISSWTFDWTSPASDVGPITLYLCTNKADGVNGNSGDEIYLSEQVLSSGGVGVEEHALNQSLVYVNELTNELMISGLESEVNTHVKLLTFEGKEIMNYYIPSGMSAYSKGLSAGLASGIYLVNMTVNDYSITKKVVIR